MGMKYCKKVYTISISIVSFFLLLSDKEWGERKKEKKKKKKKSSSYLIFYNVFGEYTKIFNSRIRHYGRAVKAKD